jgi:hypothetical protein
VFAAVQKTTTDRRRSVNRPAVGSRERERPQAGPAGAVLLSLTSNRLDVGEIRSTQSIPDPCFVPIRRPGTAKKKDRRSGCQPPPAVMSRQLKNTRSVLKSPWCSDYRTLQSKNGFREYTGRGVRSAKRLSITDEGERPASPGVPLRALRFAQPRPSDEVPRTDLWCRHTSLGGARQAGAEGS